MHKLLLGIVLLASSLTVSCAFADQHTAQSNGSAAQQVRATDAMIQADGDLDPKKCDDSQIPSSCKPACTTFQRCALNCASKNDPSNKSDKQAYDDCKSMNCKDSILDFGNCVMQSQGVNIDTKKLMNMKNQKTSM